MRKIILSMTSWTGRINNITRVLDSIANNTIKPDSVEINLSEEEFINKEKDLPTDLLNYDKLTLSINWVGKNTKSFKKLIPTVKKYYNEDCVIITVDDDVVYEPDFIEKFITVSNANPNCIISNNMCRGVFMSQQCVNGAGTLYKPHFFNNFLWDGLVQQVIDTNEDDWWYSFNLWAFGQRNVIYIPTRLKFFNEVNEHQYESKNTYNILMNYWRWLINQKEVVE